MAGSLNRREKELLAILKEEAELRQSISTSLEGYLEGMNKLKAIHKTINDNIEVEKGIRKKIADLQIEALTASSTRKAEIIKEIALEDERADVLKKQNDILREQGDILAENLKKVNKGNLLMAKGFATAVKTIGALPDIFKKAKAEFDKLGLTKLDKSMKDAALSMGVFSSQSEAFRKTLTDIGPRTQADLGVGIEELAKMQSDYSQELGRTVMLTKEGYQAMAEMSKASGLGAEGSAKMAADMELQGFSAEKTRDYTEQAMNDAHKMGINASKVVKNIAGNMKMLNKYNFKGGVNGLAKMSRTVTKLGVGMEFVSSMAEKLFDIEGAVDMSAQLQVMGGAWAKLAHPFHLMYMARNDMEGLAEEMGKAAESSVDFNKQTGEFTISALEMHRLRKIAEQTGMSYEDLAEAGKNARKATEARKQMGFSVDPELQEFIANTATWNNGKGMIKVGGEHKLLSQLSNIDKQVLRGEMVQKETMYSMAKNGQTFEEQLDNMMKGFKEAAFPLLGAINEHLMPKIKGLFERIIKEKWFDTIAETAKTIGKAVASIGGLMLDWPKTFIAAWGAAKVVGFLADKEMWFANGMLLAQGFNMGATGKDGITSILGKLTPVMSVLGTAVLTLGSAIAGWKLGETLGGKASEAMGNKSTKEGDSAAMWGALGIGAAALAIGLTGGLAAIPLAAAVGGGALAGGFGGKVIGDAMNQPIEDGIFGGDNDRGIIQGGKITPIDNKDDLVAYKPNGPVDKANKTNTNKSGRMKIEFGDINFTGEIKLTSPGSPGLTVDLLEDPHFIRNITRMIHSETEKTIQGGINKG